VATASADPHRRAAYRFQDASRLGLFVAAPWIATNVMFSQRPKSLIWMDGVYPAVGMALMGLVLSWFV
jgi:hypothetical protein